MDEIERLICDTMRQKFETEKQDSIPICMHICFLESPVLLHLTARHHSGMFFYLSVCELKDKMAANLNIFKNCKQFAFFYFFRLWVVFYTAVFT